MELYRRIFHRHKSQIEIVRHFVSIDWIELSKWTENDISYSVCFVFDSLAPMIAAHRTLYYHFTIEKKINVQVNFNFFFFKMQQTLNRLKVSETTQKNDSWKEI